MPQYVEVARSTNLWNLESAIGDMELLKGDRVRVIMDLKLPVGWAFDAPGAEWIFKPFIPDGIDLVDVYGEGSKGYVEMEADPIWLVPLLAFISQHWMGIAIAGFLLSALVISIIVMVKVAQAPPGVVLPSIVTPVVIIAGAALAYGLIKRYPPGEKART